MQVRAFERYIPLIYTLELWKQDTESKFIPDHDGKALVMGSV